jgi:class 3 adenylate cyclase
MRVSVSRAGHSTEEGFRETMAGMSYCPGCGAKAPPAARFCPECGSALTPSAQAFQAVGVADELRPVTALFADVVGSTSLGERLSPDEVKALVGECVTRMSRAVEEYGGHVQAYMGDGICALFGVPTAHEDDPDRAARAALRILTVVDEYAADIRAAWEIEDFNVRVGINSGQTAVGLVGAADPGQVAVGDATNVAARLQSAAEPGTIAVGEATARRLGQRFQLGPVGAISVKGRDEPVEVWRLLGLRDAGRSPETPFVGRATELALLENAIEDLAAGRGQGLLLVGETGIGKTRLLGELRTVNGDGATWLEGRCLSYGGPASWPFIEILRDWLGLEEGEPEIAVRTKARAKLGGLGLTRELAGLGRLLGVVLAEADEEALSPADAYAAWLEALTAQKPVVLAVDDAHWANPSTRVLAENLLDLTDRAPLLLVVAMRPDPDSEGWALRLKMLADYAHRATQLTIGPLDDDESRELLEALLPAGLDESSRDEIVRRAEGNPLYLEELLQVLVEGGDLGQQAQWTVSLLSVSRLSPELQALLVARIDLLPDPARRLVQIAAVIGRSFSRALLATVAGQAVLDDALRALLRADILREQRRYPEPEYGFRHNLFQEAALSTLTPARKRELYGRVAAAFEGLYARSLDDRLEQVAHYHAQAGDSGRAIGYLERAAAAAEARGAVEQGQALWERVQRLASRTGDPDAERRAGERLAARAR